MIRFLKTTIIYSLVLFLLFLIQFTELNVNIVIKTIIGVVISGMILASITEFIRKVLNYSKVG